MLAFKDTKLIWWWWNWYHGILCWSPLKITSLRYSNLLEWAFHSFRCRSRGDWMTTVSKSVFCGWPLELNYLPYWIFPLKFCLFITTDRLVFITHSPNFNKTLKKCKTVNAQPNNTLQYILTAKQSISQTPTFYCRWFWTTFCCWQLSLVCSVWHNLLLFGGCCYHLQHPYHQKHWSYLLYRD